MALMNSRSMRNEQPVSRRTSAGVSPYNAGNAANLIALLALRLAFERVFRKPPVTGRRSR